jgi:hypothetical protein
LSLLAAAAVNQAANQKMIQTANQRKGLPLAGRVSGLAQVSLTAAKQAATAAEGASRPTTSSCL